MNNKYLTYQQIEAYALSHYEMHGKKLGFGDIVNNLYQSGQNLQEKPSLPDRKQWKFMSQDEFRQVISHTPVAMFFTEAPCGSEAIFAEAIMPSELEVYTTKYVRGISEYMHTHNFFEVNYVMNGSCNMSFGNETRLLNQGDVCIIAPHSRHDTSIEDDSLVISLLLREATFETTFFKLIAQEDLLASFLRSILFSGKDSANFLLFKTDNSEELFNNIRDIFMECHLSDIYSNTCAVSRVHLFFSLLLREYSGSIQLFENKKTSDDHANFIQILKYLQDHYQAMTLNQLADIFHYNPSYLSRMIKKNSGRSLVEILTELKINKASVLLLHTNSKIETVSEHVGYNSVDHFSRQFKKSFGVSPQKYRQLAGQLPRQ
ncbi:MAG: AraC family transcriptional regulator [Clostridiales bacterium]|nr:AraC family transcriptional regulator [Clostridiales bacterium]